VALVVARDPQTTNLNKY